jgi:hypothetical protein
MVWLTHGELLINVVMHNKPKVLRGLNQHARKRASYQRGGPLLSMGMKVCSTSHLSPKGRQGPEYDAEKGDRRFQQTGESLRAISTW